MQTKGSYSVLLLVCIFAVPYFNKLTRQLLDCEKLTLKCKLIFHKHNSFNMC